MVPPFLDPGIPIEDFHPAWFLGAGPGMLFEARGHASEEGEEAEVDPEDLEVEDLPMGPEAWDRPGGTGGESG